MGGVIPWASGRAFYRKVEQVMGSKSVSSFPPWPLPELLSPGFYPVGVHVLTSTMTMNNHREV